jgi:hypothetical protein
MSSGLNTTHPAAASHVVAHDVCKSAAGHDIQHSQHQAAGCHCCRARELLNDFLACEAGPSLPVADLRELQRSAGLVRGFPAAHAKRQQGECSFQRTDLAVIKTAARHSGCIMTGHHCRHSHFGGSAVPALRPFWDGVL